MGFHSFKPAGTGTSDPDTVLMFEYTGGGCPIEKCTDDSCKHYVLMWSGNEYSKRNTWFTIDSDDLINLEEAR